MRHLTRSLAVGAALALSLTACSSSSDEAVTIGGFNFPESSILLETYAQALENEGVTVERQPDLGSREVIFPELTDGNIDILPEYVGGAINSGFGEDPENNLDTAVAQLTELFEAEGVAVLEPSPAEDADVFVVTADFAAQNGTSLADLAGAGDVVVAGPPECEDRDTCYAGLQSVYGLDNLSFTSIAEKSPRLAALENGDVHVITLFSTDPVFGDGSLVALEDPEEFTPPQNVIPVVNQAVLDGNATIATVLNEVSAAMTTDELAVLNGLASEGQQPADIAATWLADNGFTN